MNDPVARALVLFDDYVDLPAAERKRALAALAAREPELHAALCALLDADARHDDDHLLDRSPAQVLAGKRGDADESEAEQDERADVRLGTRLGPWRIDRVIGHGGMGTVYEAHRDDGEYQQRVALKCIRTELATPQLQAAFRDERNLLARLDHAGIAALVDGGVDEDGHPWFAMRFVDGIALDAWCDHRRASVRERVGLLIQVCEALAYAHAQGIVHRDIKPSNLLVTQDGRVQLVDFGISSYFTAQEAAPREQIAITPDYAAPEAREYGAHGPATDLYALGVLTYRLLCAQWPAPLHSLRNLIPIAASGEPVPMDRLLDARDNATDATGDSADLIARQRGAADASALRRQLAGDLSAIALKAVATRPQDRYPSVNEFADDLRRWCEHRPVSVNPGHWLSRARKWHRRSPAAALLAAALVLALCATLGVSLWQQSRAAREAQATHTVGNLFATTLGTATLSGLGSSRFSSRTLLEKTEHELQRLPLDEQPGLHARSLATLARGYAIIGDYRNAERLAVQAQRVLGSAEDEYSFVAATRVAMLNTQNHHAQAERSAREQLERLGEREDRPAQLARVTFGAELAKAQWNMGDTLTALDTADKLLRRTRDLRPVDTDLLAQVLILRAGFLTRLFRFAAAEADTREAIALIRRTNPVLADDALELLVWIHGRRRSPIEHALAQQLLRGREASLGPTHPVTARARVLLALSEYPRADSPQKIKQALDAITAAYGREHPDYGWALSVSSWAIARDPRENVRLLREAVAILERNQGPLGPLALSAKGNLGKDLLQLPDAYRTAADIAEGIALLEKIIDDKRRIGVPAPGDRINLIQALLRYGGEAQLDQAARLIEESTADARLYYAKGDIPPAQAEFYRNVLRFRRDDQPQADRGFAELAQAELARTGAGAADQAKYDRNRRAHSIMAAQALVYRALYALQTCRREQARSLLDQAQQLAETASPADAGLIGVVREYREQTRRNLPLDALAPNLFANHLSIEQTNRRAQACAAGSG
ncbi:serine/threonine protein kinase [Lysobacter capsici]|uniref:serine/threonine protein kinase n=1 Tax=Lysobacter capsici TaxID=435897 RepID=UPI00177D2D84|nr:serine/threonine-protein kinase [Lysobacter capsici]UOF16821.1 serine/threonine protein kinase [Lysobacter capsici]